MTAFGKELVCNLENKKVEAPMRIEFFKFELAQDQLVLSPGFLMNLTS